VAGIIPGGTGKRLTEEGCHRVPLRGARPPKASSWAAIFWSVRSGAAASTPATSRSSPHLCSGVVQQAGFDAVPGTAPVSRGRLADASVGQEGYEFGVQQGRMASLI
jgi:hypothetical protein